MQQKSYRVNRPKHFSCNLSRNNVPLQVEVVCCAYYHATNFYVVKSRRGFYFLQHENLLLKKVVIRATNHLNLQRNIVARQVARKMLLVLLGLKITLRASVVLFLVDNFK